MESIRLGSKVKVNVNGAIGTITARIEYISATTQFQVEFENPLIQTRWYTEAELQLA